MFAGMQTIEVRNVIHAEQDGFPVNHKRAVTIPECGLNNQRIAVAPVVPVARKQPDAGAVADDD
jgi:hypothetical protein